jgi:carboxypeptidase Q
MTFAFVHVCVILVIMIARTPQAYEYAPITDEMRDKANAIIAAAFASPNSSDVFDRLAQLTDDFGPRFSGSESLERALDWIVATATKEPGYITTTEPVMVPAWIRGSEWGTLHTATRNKTLHFVGLGMSNGTMGKIITASVIVVGSFIELQAKATEAVGKIVVFNVPFTTYGATVQYRENAGVWAMQVGAVAAIIRSVSSYSMQNTHTGSTITCAIPAAAVSVEDATQLQRLYDRNVSMTISLYMEAHQEADRPSRNIIFDLPGSEKPHEYVVFGGHTDSWDIAEGAMDDGGGIMSAWGAIRILARLRLRGKRTIRAVLWVNEENGDRGGEAYKNNHRQELNRTSLAIETDEGAFSPWTLSFSGHGAAYNQLVILSDLLSSMGVGNVTKGGGGADIGPMCDAGVPCSSIEPRDPRATNFPNNPCRDMLSTADYSNMALGSHNDIPDGYFWFHHSAADTVDRMDPTQLQTMAAVLAVWAVAVADLPELLPRAGDVPPLPSAPLPPKNDPGSSGPSSGIIAAVIVVILLAVSAIIGGGIFFARRNARRRQALDPRDLDGIISSTK